MHGGKRLRAKYGSTGDWLMNAKLGLVSSRIGDLCGKWSNILNTDWEHFKAISFAVSTLFQLKQKQNTLSADPNPFFWKKIKCHQWTEPPCIQSVKRVIFQDLINDHFITKYMWQRHKWTLKNWFLQSLYQFCHVHLWRLWHWYLQTNHSTCLLVNYFSNMIRSPFFGDTDIWFKVTSFQPSSFQ